MHIHHDASEHENCVKCFAYDTMSGADAPIVEPILCERQHSQSVFIFSIPNVQANIFTSFEARAPPSYL
jgi:hypothetical protein